MIVLAIDSSTEYGGIALWRDGNVQETVVHSPDGYAHVLFGELEALLSRCAVSLSDIDAFAAASGPGSFTGVRVALSAAKGFAEAYDKPLFAVSNLMAMASLGTAPLRAPLLDARRGEVYGGLFDASLDAVRPECVMPLRAWLDSFPSAHSSGGIEILCPYPERFAADLQDRAVTPAPNSLAPAVAALAAERLRSGDRPAAAESDANYVRRSDAELKWKEV
jgi:tRNA threonylcarbamoyladenosine biosynthesis protein TsaB